MNNLFILCKLLSKNILFSHFDVLEGFSLAPHAMFLTTTGIVSQHDQVRNDWNFLMNNNFITILCQ